MSSMKKQAKRVKSVEPINWVLLFLALVMLGGSTAATWFTLSPSTHDTAVRKEVDDEILAAQAKELDAPEIPQLKLNNKNERLGPEVTVNPGAIGKDNPFVK